jgi:hypothetical protein
MGRIIEFYAVDSNSMQSDAPSACRVPAGAKMVAAPSINSAAFEGVSDWLSTTELKPLVASQNKASAFKHVRHVDLADFRVFPAATAPGTEAIVAAVEDAVDEAIWYQRDLWIRMP